MSPSGMWRESSEPSSSESVMCPPVATSMNVAEAALDPLATSQSRPAAKDMFRDWPPAETNSAPPSFKTPQAVESRSILAPLVDDSSSMHSLVEFSVLDAVASVGSCKEAAIELETASVVLLSRARLA